jgi:hypothetical protein
VAGRPTRGPLYFVFAPKHGSRLNLIEGFFSKMARSVPRGILVASKAELEARIILGEWGSATSSYTGSDTTRLPLRYWPFRRRVWGASAWAWSTGESD